MNPADPTRLRYGNHAVDCAMSKAWRHRVHPFPSCTCELLSPSKPNPLACTCVALQAADETRHFRECPRRALHPDPGTRVVLSDNPAADRMAADFLRKHRHGVDTSEAYDELRTLLAVVVRDALWAACKAGRCPGPTCPRHHTAETTKASNETEGA